MLRSQEIQAVQQLASRLREELGARLLSLTVFGSRARGDELPESDLDVAVLLDCYDRETRNRVLDVAWELNARSGFSPALSPLVMGRAEFERLLSRERRLALDIQREGIPIDI